MKPDRDRVLTNRAKILWILIESESEISFLIKGTEFTLQAPREI